MKSGFYFCFYSGLLGLLLNAGYRLTAARHYWLGYRRGEVQRGTG